MYKNVRFRCRNVNTLLIYFKTFHYLPNRFLRLSLINLSAARKDTRYSDIFKPRHLIGWDTAIFAGHVAQSFLYLISGDHASITVAGQTACNASLGYRRKTLDIRMWSSVDAAPNWPKPNFSPLMTDCSSNPIPEFNCNSGETKYQRWRTEERCITQGSCGFERCLFVWTSWACGLWSS